MLMSRLFHDSSLVIIATVLFFAPFVGSAASGQPVLNTTVCKISENPKSFDMRLVRVSGSLESDGIERTVLVDEGCPKDGLAVSTPNHFQGEDRLARAFGSGSPGTLDKEIHGTLVGRLVWKPNMNPRLSIIVIAAKDVSVKMKD
jgi:hypothetical protein